MVILAPKLAIVSILREGEERVKVVNAQLAIVSILREGEV